MAIELSISLKDEDWMSSMGGWRCDALLIPGAKFEALYYDGSRADPKHITIERHIIIWSRSTRPKDLLVTISLAKDLPQLEQEKLRLEREKLNLEHKKAFLENRWKIIAAIGAVLSSFLTFGATYLVNLPKSKNLGKRPDIHTYIKELRVSEAECIDLVFEGFVSYGLNKINPIQSGNGIYGEKGVYNVFVSCDSQHEAIFLIVSGPDGSEAKTIREGIKRLLP